MRVEGVDAGDGYVGVVAPDGVTDGSMSGVGSCALRTRK